MAEHRTVQKDVLPRGQVQVKARAQLDQGAISPLTVTLPVVGYITPAISFSIVLLPLPLRPISATDSPGSILNEMSRSA